MRTFGRGKFWVFFILEFKGFPKEIAVVVTVKSISTFIIVCAPECVSCVLPTCRVKLILLGKALEESPCHGNPNSPSWDEGKVQPAWLCGGSPLLLHKFSSPERQKNGRVDLPMYSWTQGHRRKLSFSCNQHSDSALQLCCDVHSSRKSSLGKSDWAPLKWPIVWQISPHQMRYQMKVLHFRAP